MTYETIESFLAIAKTGSISRAAELLFITQPALTRRLKNLETELGKELFVRRQGVKSSALTAEGERFYPVAEQWLLTWQATEAFRSGVDPTPLRVASVDSLNTYVLLPFFQALSSLPNRLRFQTHHSYEIYQLIDRQEADVGFVLQEISTANTVITPVFSEKMYLMGGTELFPEGTPVHPLYLDPAREVYMNWGISNRSWHEHWFGASATPHVHIDTVALMENFLLDGYWAIVPATVAAALSARSELRTVELLEAPADRVCYMLTNRRRPLKHVSWAGCFGRLFTHYLEENPYLTPLPTGEIFPL